MKCSNLVFNSKTFSKNAGSILMLLFFVGYLVCVGFYIFKKISPLKVSISQILSNDPTNNNYNLFDVQSKSTKKNKKEDKGKENKEKKGKENNKDKKLFPPKKNIQIIYKNKPKKLILRKNEDEKNNIKNNININNKKNDNNININNNINKNLNNNTKAKNNIINNNIKNDEIIKVNNSINKKPNGNKKIILKNTNNNKIENINTNSKNDDKTNIKNSNNKNINDPKDNNKNNIKNNDINNNKNKIQNKKIITKINNSDDKDDIKVRNTNNQGKNINSSNIKENNDKNNNNKTAIKNKNNNSIFIGKNNIRHSIKNKKKNIKNNNLTKNIIAINESIEVHSNKSKDSKTIQIKENLETETIMKTSEKLNIQPNEKEIKKDEIDTKDKQNLDNYELYHLDFDDAIDLDKRNYAKIYLALLKREQLIMFTFFSWNDYNLFYVKISRFLALLSFEMVMNSLFFADETIHKLYLDEGKYNFGQAIPQIIYSLLLTHAFEILLCFLSMTDRHVYEIKSLPKKKDTAQMIFKIIKFMRIKLIVFFTFTGILFIFFWYCVSAFCAVYQKTQGFLILNTFFSFLIELIDPFIIYAIVTLLRVISLKYSDKKGVIYIYKISKFFPIF